MTILIKITPHKPELEDSKVPVESTDTTSVQFVAVSKPGKRRLSTKLVLLILVGIIGIAVVFLTSGFIGGYFTNVVVQRHGFCSIKYIDEDRSGTCELEVNIPTDDAEILEVPEIGEWSRGRIIHDFIANKTAILSYDDDVGDDLENVCFVMDLDRSVVQTPSSLWGLILKQQNGQYLPHVEVVRREMFADGGPKTEAELGRFGSFIREACKNLKSYTLKRLGAGALPGRDIDLRSFGILHPQRGSKMGGFLGMSKKKLKNRLRS